MGFLRTNQTSRRRRGATAVEFALVSPVMFLLIFGLIEFGRLVMVHQSMTNAAREGAREAILATTTDAQDVEDAVRSRLQGVIADASDEDKVRVTMSPSSLAGVSRQTPVSVEVRIDFADASWLAGSFFDFTGAELSAKKTEHRE